MIATLAMNPNAWAKSRNRNRRVIASRSGSCAQSGKRASSAARAASSSFWTIASSPAGKGRAPAIRKGAMSDKPALPDLPAGWTGGAPDADAFRAMAEAALAALPDLFRPHIADVRSEEHTSELQSLMRNSYADF